MRVINKDKELLKQGGRSQKGRQLQDGLSQMFESLRGRDVHFREGDDLK